MPDNDIDLIKRRLAREKAARLQAEAILEKKALALYNANNQLQHLNDHLEQQVRDKLGELEQSEQRYRQLIESVQDIIYKISPRGYFTFVSPVVEKSLGYTEAEFVGTHFTRFVDDDYRKPLTDFYLAMMTEGQDSTYNEFPIRSKDGRHVWIGQTVRPITVDGQIVELVAVARDVSDRKLAEQELAKARQVAEEAQRAEKQFLTNMSHEIRTPLNAIIGMSHLLFDTQPTRQQREYIDILKTSADFLHSLISDLLDMTKIEAGRIEVSPRPFDLAGLLRATQKVFEIKLHNRPVTIDVMHDARISGDFIGDDVMLNQILMNLIGNAEKFTEEGSIQITARIVQEDDNRCWIEFSVTDTGVGIPEDKQGLIFKKFRQVNPQGHKYKGTGLGLAITKELVEIQEGTISVRSQNGQGSTFTFKLPYVRATATTDNRDAGNPVLKTVGKLPVSHVMVVEDNLMNQTYIGSLLTKWKIPFTLASDGKKAVEEAKQQRFDMILMDIQMPIMDGYEATVAIRSTHNPNQHVPIIALTASAMLDHKSLAMEVGMNDFLTKPFEPSQLLNILERYAPTAASEAAPRKSDPSVKPKPTLPADDVLDRQRLFELYGSDKEHAAEMFATFLDDVVPELLQLPDLCTDQNWSMLASMAHKLKPTLGMVGLSRLEDELRQIERGLGQNIDKEPLVQRCQALVEEVTDLLPVLRNEIKTLSPKA
ncbi:MULTISPECIES: PAS domain-containing hybrid sensor histidine kinase/response regulator [Spirosoma]|uniref:Sensory/regulatory protein RpfC n=1 Tax=Spirosoma sordidisoli TaxID=2502893 RepID=A0A4Q2UGF0_9BACT|nr:MULTISPECIES: PAS domain-containing hybrid sensor histidine kinase/response regulator [Spirosoma]RYC68076.1 response regulator [Spirosoma sordidisoli]